MPQLILEAGKARGRRYPVTGPLTIGSDPAAAVAIADPVVSRQHAEVRPAGQGLCEVRDLGSSNGTAVNGETLKPGEVRLLRHGDRVYVAHYCLSFDDGVGGLRGRQRTIAIAAAIGAVLLGLLVIRLCIPDADRLLARAASQAGKERFEDALHSVDRAAEARGGREREADVAALRRQIAEWRDTFEARREALAAVREGDWPRAQKGMQALTQREAGAWGWRAGAPDLKADAARIASLLEAWSAARGLLEHRVADSARIAAARTALSEAVEACEGRLPTADFYLLLDGVAKTRKGLDTLHEESRRFTPLDGLASWPPSIGPALEQLRRTAAEGAERPAAHARAALPPLEALDRSMQRYREAEAALMAMDVAAVEKADLSLPPRDACAVEPRVEACRAQLAARFDRLRACASGLAAVLERMPDPAAPPRELQAWKDRSALNRVLGCETPLERPDPDRTQPVSPYDEYVGTEDFYAFYADLAGMLMLAPRAGPPSLLDRSRELYSRIEALLTEVAASGDDAWLSGRLAALVRSCRQDLLPAREGFVRDLLAEAGPASGRRWLVAAGIALQVSADPDGLRVDDRPLRETARDRFRDYRKTLQDLRRRLDSASGPARDEAARALAQQALPGDPLVQGLDLGR